MALIFTLSSQSGQFKRQAHRYFSRLFNRNEIEKFTACRVLPFQAEKVYDMIADVNSYSAFLPLCMRSKVTEYQLLEPGGIKWPAEAILTVGWGGIEETFTSSIKCVPGSIVEALSGDAVTIPPRDDQDYPPLTSHPKPSHNNLFRYLRTRWTIQAGDSLPDAKFQGEIIQQSVKYLTKVNLDIEYQFSNPLYTSLSKTLLPKIGGDMIKAFELRANKIIKEQ